MSKKSNIASLLKEVKNGTFMRACNIPMGYSSGYPTVRILNGTPCLTIPYLRYKITGVVDKTLVFPVRYAITVSLVSNSVVKFEDFAFNRSFAKVDFNKPIGLFRHEAIKKFNKVQYEAEKEKLYALYNKIIDCKINKTPCSPDDEAAFKKLLGILVEPSLKPFYKVIDSGFFDEYMA